MTMIDLKKLLKLIESSSLPISELEVKGEKTSVRVRLATDATPVNRVEEYVVSPPQDSVDKIEKNTEKTKDNVNLHEVKSPMVGTVYLTPSPDADPFVVVGQTVKVGDTLCLIEAMKMYNKFKADKSGVVKACLVESGQPVEYEQVLFIIE